MGLRSGEPNSVFCTENNPHSHKRGYLTCGIEVLGLGGWGCGIHLGWEHEQISMLITSKRNES